MNNLLQHKGYYGSVKFSPEDNTFFGKMEGLRSLITYEGRDVDSLRNAFEEAVEDYLETCEQEGIKPDQSFKGSYNVRMESELHRAAALLGKALGESLNEFTVLAVKDRVASLRERLNIPSLKAPKKVFAKKTQRADVGQRHK